MNLSLLVLGGDAGRDVREIFRWGRSTKKAMSYGEIVGTESTSKEIRNRTVLLIDANCKDLPM